jgi:bacterioferritin-associated ferredoxin
VFRARPERFATFAEGCGAQFVITRAWVLGRGGTCNSHLFQFLSAELAVRSVAEIGLHLQAGTNCGSCIPELKKLLRETAVTRAA